jgi:hypothetical protein
MKQATLNLDLNSKKTRKREFLEQMEQVGSMCGEQKACSGVSLDRCHHY